MVSRGCRWNAANCTAHCPWCCAVMVSVRMPGLGAYHHHNDPYYPVWMSPHTSETSTSPYQIATTASLHAHHDRDLPHHPLPVAFVCIATSIASSHSHTFSFRSILLLGHSNTRLCPLPAICRCVGWSQRRWSFSNCTLPTSLPPPSPFPAPPSPLYCPPSVIWTAASTSHPKGSRPSSPSV